MNSSGTSTLCGSHAKSMSKKSVTCMFEYFSLLSLCSLPPCPLSTYPAILVDVGLGDAGPQTIEVREEGRLELVEGSADVVADDEQQQSLRLA